VVLATATIQVCPHAALADQTLGPGTVASLHGDPAAALVAPVDGRLRVVGFAATVTGVAFVARAGTGSEAVTAAPGAQLCVVKVHVGELDSDGESGPEGSSPALTLVAGSQAVPLELGTLVVADADFTWAVAVPTGAPVSLEVARAGFAQSFDLRGGRRTTPSPLALYRDPADTVLAVPVGTSQTIAVTNRADGTTGSVIATLNKVVLSYFGLADSTPPPVDRGFLSIGATARVAEGSNLLPTGQLPGGALRLVLANGTAIASTRVDAPVDTGMFSGAFFFLVPANLTSARLEVLPAGVDATEVNQFGNGPTVTIDWAQPVSFDLTLPPLPLPLRRPAVTPSSVAAPPAARPSGGSALPVVLAVIGALVVLAATAIVVVTTRRRREGQLVLPAGRPIRALPARPTRLALPAGPPITEDWTSPVVGEPAPATEASAPVLVVRLLGPIEVDGLRHTIRRHAVFRLLVYLAVNPDRFVGTDGLRTAVALDPDRLPSPATLHSYASHLRQALPDGAFPDAGGDGYRLAESVEVDWARFRELTAAANRSGADRIGLLRQALELIRGKPFGNAAWQGVDEVRLYMEAAIEKAAHTLAAASLDDGDPAGAESAITQGLLVMPTSPQLWHDRLAAAIAGSGVSPKWVREASRQALGADTDLLDTGGRSVP
jgi:hypothetical protein